MERKEGQEGEEGEEEEIVRELKPNICALPAHERGKNIRAIGQTSFWFASILPARKMILRLQKQNEAQVKSYARAIFHSRKL